MTVNVLSLIKHIGFTFEDLQRIEIIAENKKLKAAFSGDDELHINMSREGIYLAFERTTKRLLTVNVILLDEDKPKYEFPNDLPSPLLKKMSMEWIRSTIGEPIYSQGPLFVANRWFGGRDQFNLLKSQYGNISMVVQYDMNNQVEALMFMPENAVFFRSRDGVRDEWLQRRGPIFED